MLKGELGAVNVEYNCEDHFNLIALGNSDYRVIYGIIPYPVILMILGFMMVKQVFPI